MRNNELTPKEALILLIIFFVVAISSRMIWAKLVYNDLRCTFAECRIIK